MNMVLATLSFALMGAITKLLGNRYPSVELVFFRNLIGLSIILISIVNKPLIQIGGKTKLLIFRGTIGATSLFAFYYCLTKMQLAVANTYNLTYPIFIGFLSVFIFKKLLSIRQWIALILGFVGVLFIFRPDMNYPLKYHLIGLYSGIGTSMGYLSIHYLGKFYDRRSILLSFLIGGLVLSCLSFLISMFYENAAFDFFLSPVVLCEPFILPGHLTIDRWETWVPFGIIHLFHAYILPDPSLSKHRLFHEFRTYTIVKLFSLQLAKSRELLQRLARPTT
jgi:drug/metabolite transporter (DMT)-like permease